MADLTQRRRLSEVERTSRPKKRTSALECLLLGVKQTSISGDWMSACSQKRKSVLPQEVEHWSLTTLREKLLKIGAKVVRHGRYVTFQMAEVAVPKTLSPRSCA